MAEDVWTAEELKIRRKIVEDVARERGMTPEEVQWCWDQYLELAKTKH